MFAVGRQLRLRPEGLARLTLEHVRELVPEKAELDFTDVARTPSQARAWAEWYWEKMRPQLSPAFSVNQIFTSNQTSVTSRMI